MDSDRVFCFLLTKNCSSLGVVHVIVLCHVSLKNDEELNHIMIDEGHAVLSVANIKKAGHLLHLRDFYRPQRSRCKVIFLHMSVILFTGGSGGIPACIACGIPACLAAGLWGVSQHALQVFRPTPKGVYPSMH